MQDELDKDLRSLFEEKCRSLPEEPFLGNTLGLIEKRQSRRIFMRRLIYVLGLACCALLSPILIKGSTLLSGGLGALFGAVNGFVNTPMGMTSAALCALVIMFLKQRQISGSRATTSGSGH
jgi:hypothetical protein